jgi:hypothetical protein
MHDCDNIAIHDMTFLNSGSTFLNMAPVNTVEIANTIILMLWGGCVQ